MSDDKPKTKAYLRALRTRGYGDGLAGRAPALTDPEYMRSWRRGETRRKDLGNDVLTNGE